MYRRITTFLPLSCNLCAGEGLQNLPHYLQHTRRSSKSSSSSFSDVILLAALGTVEVRVDATVVPASLGSALLIFPIMATVDHSGRLGLLPQRRIRRIGTGRRRRGHPRGRRRRGGWVVLMVMMLHRNRTGHRWRKRHAHSPHIRGY